MKQGIAKFEDRLNCLVSRAYGLEMIRKMLECRLYCREYINEIERIDKELAGVNRKIRKLICDIN